MKRITAANSTLAIGGVSFSLDSFVVGSSAVLRLNFYAKNPPLRQAKTVSGQIKKRYRQK